MAKLGRPKGSGAKQMAKCPVCAKEVNRGGLGPHVRLKHGMSLAEALGDNELEIVSRPAVSQQSNQSKESNDEQQTYVQGITTGLATGRAQAVIEAAALSAGIPQGKFTRRVIELLAATQGGQVRWPKG